MGGYSDESREESGEESGEESEKVDGIGIFEYDVACVEKCGGKWGKVWQPGEYYLSI